MSIEAPFRPETWEDRNRKSKPEVVFTVVHERVVRPLPGRRARLDARPRHFQTNLLSCLDRPQHPAQVQITARETRALCQRRVVAARHRVIKAGELFDKQGERGSRQGR